MRSDNELDIRKLLTQPADYVPLPNRVQVNVKLVNQYHAFFLKRISAIGK